MSNRKTFLEKIEEAMRNNNYEQQDGFLYGIPRPKNIINPNNTFEGSPLDIVKILTDKLKEKTMKIDKTALKDLLNLFKEYEIELPKILRDLATIFGAEASLHEISAAVIDALLPTKIVGGKTYVAGYKGTNIIPVGESRATLVSIVPVKNSRSGSDQYKLMFTVGDRYIYSTPGAINIGELIESANLFNYYTIQVRHEKIENTGDIHAVVVDYLSSKVVKYV
jgi:hypothetical protein